jgi:hypothetical protein
MVEKDRSKQKDSVLSVVILLLLIFLWKTNYWVVYFTIVFAAACVLSSGLTYFIHQLWTSITGFLGKWNAWILLTLVYMTVLMPTAVFKKIFGKKKTGTPQTKSDSGFINRDHLYNNSDFEQPW